MAGNNQSVNLQGMLNELAGAFNGMGDAYNFVPNAIRNISRPSVSMDDSASLTKYAAWARRNGFDDEAARYEALAYRQKEKEAQLAKEARVRSGESANMYNRARIAQISSDPKLSVSEKRELIQDAMAAQRAVAVATEGDVAKWNSGETALANIGQEEKARRLQMGRASVASLQNEYMRVLKDPKITDSGVRQQMLDSLQEKMNVIARTVDGMDPVRVGQLGQQSEAADLARRDREQSMDLQAQANERAWQSFDLTKDAAARAEEQHQEWVATADYRTMVKQMEAEELRYNQGVRVAKALAGVEGGKEKFLSNKNFADMEGVWNAVSRQVEQQELELQNAKDQANQNKWTYTDTQLEELGISEDMITKIKTLAETSPSSANKMVLRMLEQQYSVAEPPTAAMIGLFESAALDYIVTNDVNVDPGGLDSDEDKERAAGALALKMSQKYMETNSIEEALKVLSADKAKEDANTSAFDANLRAIEEANAAALAAQQDAVDPDR